jgi:hypothetical protein
MKEFFIDGVKDGSTDGTKDKNFMDGRIRPPLPGTGRR